MSAVQEISSFSMSMQCVWMWHLLYDWLDHKRSQWVTELLSFFLFNLSHCAWDRMYSCTCGDCTYVCMHVCVYISMYVSIYVRMCVYVCMYLHICAYRFRFRVRVLCVSVCTYVCDDEPRCKPHMMTFVEFSVSANNIWFIRIFLGVLLMILPALLCFTLIIYIISDWPLSQALVSLTYLSVNYCKLS